MPSHWFQSRPCSAKCSSPPGRPWEAGPSVRVVHVVAGVQIRCPLAVTMGMERFWCVTAPDSASTPRASSSSVPPWAFSTCRVVRPGPGRPRRRSAGGLRAGSAARRRRGGAPCGRCLVPVPCVGREGVGACMTATRSHRRQARPPGSRGAAATMSPCAREREGGVVQLTGRAAGGGGVHAMSVDPTLDVVHSLHVGLEE